MKPDNDKNEWLQCLPTSYEVNLKLGAGQLNKRTIATEKLWRILYRSNKQWCCSITKSIIIIKFKNMG